MKRDEKHRDGASDPGAETKMKLAVPSAAATAASGAAPEAGSKVEQQPEKKSFAGFIQGLSGLIALHPSDLDGIREKVLILRDYANEADDDEKAALNQLLLQAAGATAPTKQQTDAIESVVGRE